jgi:UDP-N-acetylmuramate--alanine ligase
MKSYHFIGIGGIGMSALAHIVLDRGCKVSGSDLSENSIVMKLRSRGVDISIGHSAAMVKPNSTVVYSTAVKEDNPEWCAAKGLGCDIMHRSELLGQLTEGRKTIAVTGTHGKTTISSILASVLKSWREDTAFAVGGIVYPYDRNGTDGGGGHFVVEADESDGSFLAYNPFAAIVSNVESEHLDQHKTLENLHNAFRAFFDKSRSAEHFLWCGDDEFLIENIDFGESYGFSENCDWRVLYWRQEGWQIRFDIAHGDDRYNDIVVNAIGEYNVLNCLSIFALALKLGMDEQIIRRGLRDFGGIARRVDRFDCSGISLVDDYAHHPTEIVATMQALRHAVKERRIILLFQPHRYSRTKDCLELYSTAFGDADEVIITDIYAASEQPIVGITPEVLVDRIAAPARYIGWEDLFDWVTDNVRPHDVIVTMGAGSITTLHGRLKDHFADNGPKKLSVGVLAGGRSSEHEISMLSGQHIYDSLSREYYDVKFFKIEKDGSWDYKDIKSCDIVLPIFHGPMGEDGMIQGFLETLGIAYVGCDYSASAICMDKWTAKCLVADGEIPTLPFVGVSKHDKNFIIPEDMHYPLFIKPAHLGSSIGISKVDDDKELLEGVEEALEHDDRMIIEQGVVCRELEFAVLGNEYIEVPPPGEVNAKGEFYSYDAKYGGGGFSTVAQADLTAEIIEKGRYLARRAYILAGCQGLARVDFFLDQEDNFWFNEINPMPGFTAISLYPKIWEAHGVNITELLDRFIILGLHSKRCPSPEKVGL